MKTAVHKLYTPGERECHYAYADWKVANYAQPICGQKNRPSDVFTGWATKDVPPLCFECSVQYVLQDCEEEPEGNRELKPFWQGSRHGLTVRWL